MSHFDKKTEEKDQAVIAVYEKDGRCVKKIFFQRQRQK